MRITPTPKCGLKLLQIRVRAQPLSLLYFNSTCKLIVPYYSNRNIRKNGCNRNVEKMIFEFVVSMNSKIGYQVQQVSNHTCHIILNFWFIPLNDIYLFLYLRLLLSNSIFLFRFLLVVKMSSLNPLLFFKPCNSLFLLLTTFVSYSLQSI